MVNEFKKFDDVSVEVTDFDFEVSVVVAKAEGGTGQSYVISLVVAKSPSAIKSSVGLPSALIGHTLEKGDNLEDLLRRIATETNTHVFDEVRAAQRH